VQTRSSANLDFLRAVAVLMVLGQHLMNRFRGDSPPVGRFGVLIFFVHTSLVLMYSMERSGLRGNALLANFYIRRIFRIYPLSVLAVLVAVMLRLDSGVNGVAGLSHVASIPGWRIFSNLLLAQNVIKPGSIINVLWSLPYEIQMYIFLPFFFLWVRRGRAPARSIFGFWLISAAAALVLGYMGSHFQVGSLSWRLSLLQFVPNFLPGILAFTLPHRPILRSFWWPVFIFAIAGLFVLSPTGTMGWGLCLALGCAIPYFEEIKIGWIRLASHRIAMYSYGIYLSHQFCIWLIADPLGSWHLWLRIAALTVSVAAIPVLLYHAIEKPMIELGSRLAERCDFILIGRGAQSSTVSDQPARSGQSGLPGLAKGGNASTVN